MYDVVEQQKEYLEGIGAYDFDQLPQLSRVGKVVQSGFEIVFATFVLCVGCVSHPISDWFDRNVGKNVKRAYRWLAVNYQEGDRIYLFGAYTFAVSFGGWC